ncbi:predicted protein [Lichtheimia corymbifera JMRC:FSU:9682]|uniref:Uncharacterized protein n=1 Tax=Lichtheimia corymbifera JMRC:FSU:9682 TaxID=1263082 RepID=A0A068RLZ5_9FUNG|nr:predicted protein [Lichtheimia corymbifera JMRC:FSU:9682]
MDKYRHSYSGTDPYLLFFTSTDFKNWDFQHFADHFSTKAKKTLVSSYRKAVEAISKDIKTPKGIKSQLKRLIDNIDQPALQQTHIYHGDIHQGDGSTINFGDNSSGSTTNNIVNQREIPERSSKRQKTAIDEAGDQAFDGTFAENESAENNEKPTEKENEYSTLDAAQVEPLDVPSPIEPWDVESEDDFWHAYLELLLTDIPHNLSLERMHIIQCGFSIVCDPRVPSDFHSILGLQGVSSNLCKDSLDYITPYLTAARNKNLDGMMLAAVSVDRLHDKRAKTFLRHILTQYSLHVFSNVDAMKASETGFNHQAIWPLLAALAASMDNALFIPGETTLRAINGHPIDTEAGCYKADGVVTIKDGFELLILETSGCYGNTDKPRHGSDHIKGAFGARMMLRAIIMKFYYGGDEVHDLCVYFAHARGCKLHVWSLSMPTRNGDLVLERIMSMSIPTLVTERNVLLEMLNYLWALQILLHRTVRIMGKMQDNHTCVLERFAIGDSTPPPQDLRHLIKKSDCQKPTKQQGTGDLLPNSDPLDDDDILTSPSLYHLIIENIEDDG